MWSKANEDGQREASWRALLGSSWTKLMDGEFMDRETTGEKGRGDHYDHEQLSTWMKKTEAKKMCLTLDSHDWTRAKSTKCQEINCN